MEEKVCHVCGGVLDGENTAACNFCGRPFHMAWSNKAEIDNCGRFWFDQMSCGMVFICRACEAERIEAQSSQPPWPRWY